MEMTAATPEEWPVCPPGSALCLLPERLVSASTQLLPEPLISAHTQLLLVKALPGASVSLVTTMLPLQ